MQVDEMAGRELDVLVAQMMGWVWAWEWERSVGEPKKWYRQLVDPSWNWDMLGEPEPEDAVMEDRFVHAPNHSTDIAAILSVAEQVVGTGNGNIKITLLTPDTRNTHYLAQVALWLGYTDPVRALAEAATGTEAIALALARAVVKAKGVETAP
jgi:hypothetical protein